MKGKRKDLLSSGADGGGTPWGVERELDFNVIVVT